MASVCYFSNLTPCTGREVATFYLGYASSWETSSMVVKALTALDNVSHGVTGRLGWLGWLLVDWGDWRDCEIQAGCHTHKTVFLALWLLLRYSQFSAACEFTEGYKDIVWKGSIGRRLDDPRYCPPEGSKDKYNLVSRCAIGLPLITIGLYPRVSCCDSIKIFAGCRTEWLTEAVPVAEDMSKAYPGCLHWSILFCNVCLSRDTVGLFFLFGFRGQQ